MVVDNPPFSLLNEIAQWFNRHGIRYLLFAHPSTHAIRHATIIVAGQPVTYESGLNVQTEFITNMLGDTALITAPELGEALANLRPTKERKLKSFIYPERVLRISEAGMMARRGINIRISRSDCAVVGNIGGEKLYGLSYILSDSALDRLRPVRQRIDRPGAIQLQLSPEQLEIARSLDGYE